METSWTFLTARPVSYLLHIRQTNWEQLVSFSIIAVDFIFVEVNNLQMELRLCHILVPRARLTRSQQSMTRVEGYENGLCHNCRSKFSL